MGFIDATEAFLREGLPRPRPEFFRSDGVHPNAKGYAVWTVVVRKAFGF